jgi:hypothetical protein
MKDSELFGRGQTKKPLLPNIDSGHKHPSSAGNVIKTGLVLKNALVGNLR